jgi:hypothetical protein
MAYEKLTGKAFKEALQSDRYESATAARRAVGKASTLSDQEKDQCRKAIDVYFGESSEKVTSEAKRTPKAKPGRVAKGDKSDAIRSSKSADKVNLRQPGIFGPQTSGGSLDDYTNLTVQMKIAEKTIQNAGSALGTLIEAKKISPDSDLTSSIEAASAVLSSAVEIFRGVTHKVTAYLANAARNDLSENHSTSSGGNGKPLFEEASP